MLQPLLFAAGTKRSQNNLITLFIIRFDRTASHYTTIRIALILYICCIFIRYSLFDRMLVLHQKTTKLQIRPLSRFVTDLIRSRMYALDLKLIFHQFLELLLAPIRDL